MSEDGFRVALNFVCRYRHFYRGYLEQLSASEYLEAMFHEIWAAETTLEDENRTGNLYHYIFTLGGAIKVVKRWLKHGCKEPVDTMAKLLTQYVTP